MNWVENFAWIMELSVRPGIDVYRDSNKNPKTNIKLKYRWYSYRRIHYVPITSGKRKEVDGEGISVRVYLTIVDIKPQNRGISGSSISLGTTKNSLQRYRYDIK